MTFYSQSEIAEYELDIPSDDDINILLERLEHREPICGSLSQSLAVPNAFCACSRAPANTVTLECDLCE